MEIFLPIEDKNGAQAVFSIFWQAHTASSKHNMYGSRIFWRSICREKRGQLVDTLDIQDVLLTIIGSETPLN